MSMLRHVIRPWSPTFNAAVFLAQLQLAVCDAKKGVALIEYRAARVSKRGGADLGLIMTPEAEFRFEVFHFFVASLIATALA